MEDLKLDATPGALLPEGVAGDAVGFFEKMVQIAPVILYIFDLKQMRNVWVNRSIFAHLGYCEAEIAGFGETILEQLVHPDDMGRYPAHMEALLGLEDGTRAIFEYRMRTKLGEWRWLRSEEMPYARDAQGEVIQIIGSAADITDVKTRESQIEIVSSEMSHRVKNMFSVINSMVRLTGRHETELGPAIKKLSERITALSMAHSIARTRDVVEHATIREVIDSVLRPFAEDYSISITGDNPGLIWEQITPFSLILHELATNALKYGAFADPDGRLELVIALDQDIIAVKWYEYCVPVGKAGGERGFGTRMIDGSIAQMSGTCERDLTPEGKRIALTFPVRA